MNTSHPYSPQKARYDKNYAKNHKPERLAYRQKWNPLWRQTPTGRYSIFCARAKQRHLMVDLAFDQFMVLAPLPCFYCGGDRSTTWGLDRIDNEQGYTLVNVRPCCRPCNVAKNDMTEAEFKTWAIALAKHWL